MTQTFTTPRYRIESHPLSEEAGKPAVQWTTETVYQGDNIHDASTELWTEIHNPNRTEPWVIFTYINGDLRVRIDVS